MTDILHIADADLTLYAMGSLAPEESRRACTYSAATSAAKSCANLRWRSLPTRRPRPTPVCRKAHRTAL